MGVPEGLRAGEEELVAAGMQYAVPWFRALVWQLVALFWVAAAAATVLVVLDVTSI